MPGGNGTGPGGRGPGTGWGMGPCGGRGFRGRRMGKAESPQTLTSKEELKLLKEERAYIEKRITEIEKTSSKK